LEVDQSQAGTLGIVIGNVATPVLKYYGQIFCPLDRIESISCPGDFLGSIACPVDLQYGIDCPGEFNTVIACPMDIGAFFVSKPIANSTNQFQMTLVRGGVRVLDATVTLNILAPDGITTTLSNATVPHVGNGVYLVKTTPAAVPKKGVNYQAIFHILQGTDEFNPKYYFEAYEN
jgi:hypothetical protein